MRYFWTTTELILSKREYHRHSEFYLTAVELFVFLLFPPPPPVLFCFLANCQLGEEEKWCTKVERKTAAAPAPDFFLSALGFLGNSVLFFFAFHFTSISTSTAVGRWFDCLCGGCVQDFHCSFRLLFIAWLPISVSEWMNFSVLPFYFFPGKNRFWESAKAVVVAVASAVIH